MMLPRKNRKILETRQKELEKLDAEIGREDAQKEALQVDADGYAKKRKRPDFVLPVPPRR